MPSTTLPRIIKDLSQFSELVEVSFIKDGIKFSSGCLCWVWKYQIGTYNRPGQGGRKCYYKDTINLKLGFALNEMHPSMFLFLPTKEAFQSCTTRKESSQEDL